MRPRTVESHELLVARAASRSLNAAPVDVAFDAKHRARNLIIVADGAADHAAAEVEAAGGIPVRSAKAAAAVDADVQSAPVVGRRHKGRRFVVSCGPGGRSAAVAAPISAIKPTLASNTRFI